MTELQKLVGKTVSSVEVSNNYFNEPETIKLSFTDGSYIRIDASGSEDLQWLMAVSNVK